MSQTTEKTTKNFTTTMVQCRYDQTLWHPVNYDLFLKLKELKKMYFLTLYAVGRYRRWAAKTVHQHGPAPRYCPIFVSETGSYKTVKHYKVDPATGEKVLCGSGEKWQPLTINTDGVLQAYEQARRPTVQKHAAIGIDMPEAKVELLHSQALAWFKTYYPKLMK